MSKEKMNKEKNTFEKIGGTYIEMGDYMIPGIVLDDALSGEDDRSMEDVFDGIDSVGGHIGKYGLLRKEYLKKHKKSKFQIMTLQNTLDKHLTEVDTSAREREEVIMRQLEKETEMPDKDADQMAWVKQKNQHRVIAEEIILADIIYV